MTAYVSERDIFRATTGLAMHASLARTLAYCIFWSQYAQHQEEGVPIIWKTGPEMEADLKVAARTGNRHLKELAGLGYWTLSYRPRPGTIGKVSWLIFNPQSLALLQLAREQAVSRLTKRKAQKVTSEGSVASQLVELNTDDPWSQDVTLKQEDITEKTTKNGKSFILSGKAGKAGMNETSPKFTSGEYVKFTPKPPKYVKASEADYCFANLVQEVWTATGLQEWDWLSIHTWKHIAEIRTKATKIGLLEDELKKFLVLLLENWSWLRHCMASRYAHHSANLHAPSPMALAHEFDILGSKVLEKLKPPTPKPKTSNLDEGFF